MEISRSIKTKLFALLIVMGAIPFIIVVLAGAARTVSELEEAAASEAVLRNFIVSDHVTEMFEKNFYALHALALNPMIIDYVKSPTDNHRVILQLLKETNFIFHDANHMGLTGADGMQLFRTDGSALVNISKRRHFQEAMKGHDFVSDMIVSMSTGEMIVVLEVPVKDEENNPIGMLQRNFDLSALQTFVKKQDTEKSYVLIIDREGRVIADSDKQVDPLASSVSNGKYNTLIKNLIGSTGLNRMFINGADSLVSHSRNELTDWRIVTVQPYHFILDKVYVQMAKLAILGLLMLVFISLTAYLLSKKVTKPIIEITKAADRIVKGTGAVEKLEIDSNDELGQMAEAFNKMRSSRDSFQHEAQFDKLTKLYNKATMEVLCREQLRKFLDQNEQGKMLALYVIDLDHFKEVNDTLGHQTGDQVLIEFAKNLRKCFRPTDVMGRFGGDEFVVIIAGMPSMDVIIRKAEQIKQMASELRIDGKLMGITSSIGISIAPQHGRRYEELFASADQSLYYVKKHGRNNYHVEQSPPDF